MTSNTTTDFASSYTSWTANAHDPGRVATLLAAVHSLMHDGVDLTDDQLTGTLALMNARLSFRDALIIGALRPDKADTAYMAQCALHPHSDTRMDTLIEASYKTGTGWDETVADRFDGLMTRVQTLCEDRDRRSAQPLATRAYLAWWRGDRDAMRLAYDALTADPDCNLARIVMAATTGGVSTAIAQKRR